MTVPRQTLFDCMADPALLAALEPRPQQALLRLARRAALLTRLGARLDEAGCLDRLAPRARDHLRAAGAVAEHHARSVRWEMNRVRRALRDLDVKTVLVKGAAYVMQGLPVARGRLVNDVDILVPRAALAAVERALLEHGWVPLGEDEYDDSYYRRWMHELPPLRHRERGAVIDVHHTILPLTGRLHPDPQLLFAAARPLPQGGLYVLAPEDMVLHSAAHAFQDGDLGGGLRDLADLDSLLRHFGAQEDGFWQRLVPRARQLQLARPLCYALRYAGRVWRTPIPEEVANEVQRDGPRWPVRRLMDALVARAVAPVRGGHPDVAGDLSRLMLYVRSHWLRMPPLMLARHLARKAARRYFDRSEADLKPREGGRDDVV